MRGGHNIKSTAEKKLSGTSRADRDSDRMENHVDTLKNVPRPPEYFDADHRAKWNDICEKIIDIGALTSVDIDAVESYVKNCIISQTAWKDICENGQLLCIETRDGQKPITNPSLSQFNEAESNMKRLMNEFGMTPRARMGIKVTPKQAEKPGDNLFK